MCFQNPSYIIFLHIRYKVSLIRLDPDACAEMLSKAYGSLDAFV